MTPEEQALVDQIKQMINSGSSSVGTVGTGTITTNVPVGQAPYIIQAAGTGNPYGAQPTMASSWTITTSDLDEKVPDLPFSDSPDIPQEAFEMEAMSAQGIFYTIRYAPDSSMSTKDALKIMMMFMVEDPVVFSSYEYILKHGLERHFTFTEQR